MFNWLPPVPLPHGRRITYEIKIVEILERQTAYYAMLSNPSWFRQNDIATTLFQYPLAARQNNLREQVYTWKVNTFIDGIQVIESETWEYTYDVARKILEVTNDKLRMEMGSDSINETNIDINLDSDKYSQLKKHTGKVPSLYERTQFATSDFESEFLKEKRVILKKKVRL